MLDPRFPAAIGRDPYAAEEPPLNLPARLGRVPYGPMQQPEPGPGPRPPRMAGARLVSGGASEEARSLVAHRKADPRDSLTLGSAWRKCPRSTLRLELQATALDPTRPHVTARSFGRAGDWDGDGAWIRQPPARPSARAPVTAPIGPQSGSRGGAYLPMTSRFIASITTFPGSGAPRRPSAAGPRLVRRPLAARLGG